MPAASPEQHGIATEEARDAAHGRRAGLFRRGLSGAMRRVLYGLLIALALPALADDAITCPPVATPPTQETVQAAMSRARDHGFLWRISKDGRTSYLYGTIHVAKFDWMFPGPGVMRAIAAADTVALELDLLDADIRERMLKGMQTSRRGELPASLVQRLRRQADAMCVPYAAIAGFSPEMQITTLTVMAGRTEGLEPSYAIDSVLAGIGHGANKQMVSLETPESQMRVLQSGDAQATAVFVREGLAELEAGRSATLLKRIAAVWADADHAQMERFDEWCECRRTQSEREMMKRLLDDRNPALADRIDALHAGGKRVFAAVGSLHMFGKLGLPALMARRGYRVEPVHFSPR